MTHVYTAFPWNTVWHFIWKLLRPDVVAFSTVNKSQEYYFPGVFTNLKCVKTNLNQISLVLRFYVSRQRPGNIKPHKPLLWMTDKMHIRSTSYIYDYRWCEFKMCCLQIASLSLKLCIPSYRLWYVVEIRNLCSPVLLPSMSSRIDFCWNHSLLVLEPQRLC